MAKITKKNQRILDLFESINKVPRCSRHEEKICQWLMDWAIEHHLVAHMDQVGNILIQVPGTVGMEGATPVVIQGHVDMVCEKDSDSSHDFSVDPIRVITDGDWVKAHKTTLGADNGIAIAMALAIAEDPKIPHPPLELLFTIDEETGLTGALALEPNILTGKFLLNLDSEDEGVFTIGCAGSRQTDVALPLSYEDIPEDYSCLKIAVDGLNGGHSGVNIHLGRANALKMLGRTLSMLKARVDVRLTYIAGGTAHNVIPRSAEARIFVPSVHLDHVRNLIGQVETTLKKEFAAIDPELNLKCFDFHALSDRRGMSVHSTEQVIRFLLAFPHGVAAMSHDVEGLVETSNNLASVRVEEGELRIISSQRSSVMSRLNAITEKVEAVAHLAGAAYRSNTGYPAWQPNIQSPLLEIFKSAYKKKFKKEAKVEAIHAGLECGIIGAKYPGLDMISFGVTLKDPHSPKERMFIPSIGKVWDLLLEILAVLGKK